MENSCCEEVEEINSEKFSFFRGSEVFFKGIYTKGLRDIIKGLKNHPVLVISLIALVVWLCTTRLFVFMMWLLTALGVFGAIFAFINILKSVIKSVKNYNNKKYIESLDDIEIAGGETFNVALSIFGAIKSLQAARIAAKAAKVAYKSAAVIGSVDDAASIALKAGISAAEKIE